MFQKEKKEKKKRSQNKKHIHKNMSRVGFHSHEISRIEKSIEISLVDCQGLGEMERNGLMDKEFYSAVREMFWT